MILRSWGLVGSRKSAGGLTTLNYKGQTIGKQKRAKGQSNPSPQYLQSQAAYLLLVGIFQKIKPIIIIGWPGKKRTESAFNKFFSYNYKHGIDLTVPPIALLLPGNILTSKGNLTPTPYSSIPTSDTGSNEVVVYWEGGVQAPDQSEGDIGFLAVYNQTTNEWWSDISSFATRSIEGPQSQFFNPPIGFISVADVLYVYLNWHSVDENGNLKGPADSTVGTCIVTV